MFKLTSKQVEANEVLAGRAAHVLLYGGSRSAKTFTIVRAIVIRALLAPNSRHAIVGFRFNRVKTAIGMDTFPKVMTLCFPSIKYKTDKSEWYFSLPNGSEIWLGGLDDKERTEKVLGKEFCVHPDSVVLMADLTWKRAQDVTKGDEIIAFPESLDGHMKLIRSTVEWNKLLTKKRYKVVTNKGTTIVSEGHKFVTHWDDRRERNFRSLSWKSIEELSPGDKLRFSIAPWTTDKSFDGGWLSGIYDGEGWIAKGNGSVGVAQNHGLVLERIKELLINRGFSVRTHISQKCTQLISLNMWDAMRIVGSLRPTRLLAKSLILWENRRGFNGHGNPVGSPSRHKIRTEARHVAEILSIERIEDGEVRGIQTSSKTLITDGFLSHNCSIFLNECSQISDDSRQIVTTRLAQKCTIQKQNQPNRPLRLKMFYDENPPKKSHWSYKLFIKKVDPADGLPLKNQHDYASLKMNPIENLENLADGYMETLNSLSAAKRRRFRDGEFGDANPNQLFDSDNFERYRVIDLDELPDMVRIVVPVDPSGADDTNNEDNDAIGIVPCGLGTDGIAYILADRTVKAGPATWGRVVSNTFEELDADTVVGEENYGGAMVKHVIRTANSRIPYKKVTATRGKVVRAEPVSALFEQGKVRIVGYLRELEEELEGFTTAGYEGSKSPNRADSAIWGIYALFPHLTQKKEEPIYYDQPEPTDPGCGY